MGSRISIGPGIEEGEPCSFQGAPRAVFHDALEVLNLRLYYIFVTIEARYRCHKYLVCKEYW